MTGPAEPAGNGQVVIHNDSEQAHGLHQRRGVPEGEPSSSSNQGSPPDVEAAIAHQKEGNKDIDGAAEQEHEEKYVDVTFIDIAKQFSILGWTAFGGPAAHIGYFQRVSMGQCNHMQQRVTAVRASSMQVEHS